MSLVKSAVELLFLERIFLHSLLLQPKRGSMKYTAIVTNNKTAAFQIKEVRKF